MSPTDLVFPLVALGLVWLVWHAVSIERKAKRDAADHTVPEPRGEKINLGPSPVGYLHRDDDRPTMRH